MSARNGNHMRQAYRFHVVVQAVLFELAPIAYHDCPHERRATPLKRIEHLAGETARRHNRRERARVVNNRGLR